MEDRRRARGVGVDPTPVLRWGPREAPELERRGRPPRHVTNAASRGDKPDIRLTKHGGARDRAGDSTGAPLDGMLSFTHEAHAAAQVCRKVRGAGHTATPRLMTIAKHAAEPPACEALQQAGTLPATGQLRHCTSLPKLIDHEHRWVQRRVNPGWGVGACATAPRPIQGDEARPMIWERSACGDCAGDVLTQHQAITQMRGWPFHEPSPRLSSPSTQGLPHSRIG